MTTEDQYDTALCIWREARGNKDTSGSSYRAMSAVACVIKNRVDKQRMIHPFHGMTVPIGQEVTFADIVLARYQFSSMDPGDPQYHTVPQAGDAQWSEAQDIAAYVTAGDLADITGGASLYYSDYIPFPAAWDKSKVIPTVQIGNMKFFREI